MSLNRTQKITHNGKSIFYMDFSMINTIEEINRIISGSIKEIRNQPPSSLLTLTNISGMHFNQEIKEAFQHFIAGNKPYVKAGAVVGLNGLQQILYNSLMKITGRNIKSFSDLTAAKNWLSLQN
jgi:hypothetical protein